MADGFKTLQEMLGTLPDAVGRVRGQHEDSRGYLSMQAVRNLLQSVFAWAVAWTARMVDTGLVFTDGSSGSTIALYRVDWTVGDLILMSFKRFALATDVIVLGAGEWGKSHTLAGATPAALTADGQTYWVVWVVILVSGVPTLHAVFGDEAADTGESKPDESEIQTALAASSIAGYDPTLGLIVGETKIQRVAVDTINMTHTAITVEALAAQRARGTLAKLGVNPP